MFINTVIKKLQTLKYLKYKQIFIIEQRTVLRNKLQTNKFNKNHNEYNINMLNYIYNLTKFFQPLHTLPNHGWMDGYLVLDG